MSTASRTLALDLGARSYNIEIGSGLLGAEAILHPLTANRQILLVSNECVAPLYADRLKAGISGAIRFEQLALPDGEQHKTLETANQVFDALLEHGYNRDCCLIAMGGGVIGDLTGFVAATYQRGVDFLQVPTTLLAQVDASVGGKTAVNHRLGKNMIGAFHQPRLVLIDTDTLQTLPDREYRAGIAEVIKYGLLGDIAFLEWIEAHLDELLAKDQNVVSEAIFRSCENKARIVAADATERTGQRALLNLGHSFGHAIETAKGYGTWLHGEAVAAGMCMAADLSRRLQWVTEKELARCIQIVERAGLPTRPPEGMTVNEFSSNMARDKKVAGGRLRLILLKGLGNAIQTSDYDDHALQQTLAHYCGS